MKKIKIALLVCLCFILIGFLLNNRVKAKETFEYTVSNLSEFCDALKANSSDCQKTIYINGSVDYEYNTECVGQIIIRPLSSTERATIRMTNVGNSIGPNSANDSLTIERINFVLIGGSHSYLFKMPLGGKLFIKDSTITGPDGTNISVARPIYGASGSPLGKISLENVDFGNVTATTAFNYRCDVSLLQNVILPSTSSLTGSGGKIIDFQDCKIQATGSTTVALSTTGDVTKSGSALETEIYYTSDGTDPRTNGILYEFEIDVPTTNNFIIQAVVKIKGEDYYGSIYRFVYNEKIIAPEVVAGDIQVNYLEKNIFFDDAIEANREADFSGSFYESGKSIAPGEILYFRYKSTAEYDAGNIFTYTVKARPAAPVVEEENITATTIIVKKIDGAEYKLASSNIYQDSNIFTNLISGKEYVINVRLKATSSSFESEDTTFSVCTLDAFGEVIDGDYYIDYDAETIFLAEGVEANSQQSFDGQTYVSQDHVLPSSKIYIRYAKTPTLNAGPVKEVILSARPIAPKIIEVLSKSNTTITMVSVSGCEYAIDSYSDSNVFTGLTPQTEYTIKQRIKATALSFASEETTIRVTTASSDEEISEVSTYEALRDMLSIKSAKGKVVILLNDITVEDTIDIYGTVLIKSKDERVTITYKQEGSSYIFCVRPNTIVTFENIKIYQPVENGYATFYFSDKDSTTGLGNGVLKMNNCEVERTVGYRIFHPAYNGSSMYITDTILKCGGGYDFYRGNVYLYGLTNSDGNTGSGAIVYDYRKVSVSSNIGTDYKVVLSKIGEATMGGKTLQTDIYYTLDGSDPLTSSTRMKYTEAIVVSSVILVKYSILSLDENGVVVSHLNKVISQFYFRYVIDYFLETISFDPNVIELSLSSDFALLFSNNEKIIPGTVVYGREKLNPANIFQIVIPERSDGPVCGVQYLTDTEINLETNTDWEYGMQGEDYQSSSLFSALMNNTSYVVKVRIKATENTFASNETIICVKTKGKMRCLTLQDIKMDYENQQIIFTSDIEVNTSSDFNENNSVTSGSAIYPQMTLYARFMGNEDTIAGDTLVVTTPAKPIQPENLNCMSETHKIIIDEKEGYEYKIGDDGDWQDSSEFVGLAANTEYMFKVRVKATDTNFSSDEIELFFSTIDDSTNKGCQGVIGIQSITILMCLGTIVFFRKKKGEINE